MVEQSLRTIEGLSDEFIARFWSLVDRRGDADCWEWRGNLRENGYGRITINGARFIASRLSLMLHLKRDLMPTELACHHCDNPPCVNPAHLFAGSAKDNMRDCSAKGRIRRWNGARRGGSNPNAMLSTEQALTIKAQRGKVRQHVLAKQFGVSQAVVSSIQTGRGWRHLSDAN